MRSTLTVINRDVTACRRCPRLVAYREKIAEIKRRAYLDQTYWGKPVPAFGDPHARLLILGLAPGAHGANRTGRMFTGDKSGDFLYRALFETGFASQPHSTSIDDGLALQDAYITASVRCAPPDNKPAPEEFRNCRPYLERELGAMKSIRVVVALGQIAMQTYLSILKDRGAIASRAPYVFGHGREYPLEPILLASYHPSQQNTSTGKLTAAMLRSIFERARTLLS